MTREELEAELVGTDAVLTRIGGCSDGFCHITGRAKGMHTNGGCRCARDQEARRALLALQQLREKVRTYLQAKD